MTIFAPNELYGEKALARPTDQEVVKYGAMQQLGDYLRGARLGVYLTALGALAATGCSNGSGDGPTAPNPGQPAIICAKATGTFDGQPLTNYTLTINGPRTGTAPSNGNEACISAESGVYNLRIEGPMIFIPREKSSVSAGAGNNTVEIDAVESSSGFNVGHFEAVAAQPTMRFDTPGLRVYAVGTERNGQVERATQVVSDISRGALSAFYGGLGDTRNAVRGDIFVVTTSDIPGGAGSTVVYHGGRNLEWAEVLVRPNASQETVDHEVARALGFPGNGAPPSSIFYNVGNNGRPSDDDRDTVELNYKRRTGATISSAVDRD